MKNSLNCKDDIYLEAIHSCWERGTLDYLLRPAQEFIQEKFNNITGKLFVANCSRRLGKSWWTAKICIEICLRNPDQQVIFASALAKDVEEIIIPAFKHILSSCPVPLMPTYTSSKKKYIFPNGSSVNFCGLDRNPDGVRGRFCDTFIFDEAGFIDNLDYLYSSVVVPMFKGRRGAKAIMISTPPKTPSHPFHQFCQKAQSENAYIKLTIHDDPLTTEDEKNEFKKECLTETDWQREYLCEFVTDENLAIIPEFKDEYIQEYVKDEFWGFYHKYVGLDIGIRDKTIALYGVYDFLQAKLFILDEWEISGPQTTTQKIADGLEEKEKEVFGDKPPYLRVGDNNNLLLLQDLSIVHNLPFSAVEKTDLYSMVNKVRMWMKQGRIIVSPKCTQLIGCLKYGIWKENRKEFDRSILYGHFDALAACIYLCRNVNTFQNPIPSDYRFDSANQINMIPVMNNNQNKTTLNNIFSPRGDQNGIRRWNK